MIDLTQNISRAIEEDLSLIWIVKLTLDAETLYWSSKRVTISGQEYVGSFIVKGSMGEISGSCDLLQGGNLASMGNMRINLNQLAQEQGTHRMFKPEPAGAELINRRGDIGIVADVGTLSTTDITWLFAATVDDANSNRSAIFLDLVGVG